MSKQNGIDDPSALSFWRALAYQSSFYFSRYNFMDCLVISLASLDEFITHRTFQVMLIDPSSSQGRGTLFYGENNFFLLWISNGGNSFSWGNAYHIARGCLSFSFGLLSVTTVHYWLSTRSEWTYMVSPWGVETGTRPFSFLLWGSVLITLSFPFRMGTTPIGANGRSLPNWRGIRDVILVVTFLYSWQSLSTFASIRAWRTSLKMKQFFVEYLSILWY